MFSYSLDSCRAAIFDMDGLLLDSENSRMELFKKACSLHGAVPNMEAYLKCIGRDTRDGEYILKQGHGSDFPYDAIMSTRNTLYMEEVRKGTIKIQPGVKELLDYLHSKLIPCAVATSTDKETALKKLQTSDLLHFFSEVISGEEVPASKPAPDIFLEAAARLSVNPEKCLVFEDSDNGIRAAVSAGTNPIQVPDLLEPQKEIKELGHIIVPSLVQATEYLKQTWRKQ